MTKEVYEATMKMLMENQAKAIAEAKTDSEKVNIVLATNMSVMSVIALYKQN